MVNDLTVPAEGQVDTATVPPGQPAVQAYDPSPQPGETPIGDASVYDPYGEYARGQKKTDADRYAEEVVAVHETSPGIYDPYGSHARAEDEAKKA